MPAQRGGSKEQATGVGSGLTAYVSALPEAVGDHNTEGGGQ